MRKKFDEELDNLNEEMLKMSMIVESSIEKAVSLLQKRDEDVASEVINYERETDKLEYSIQNHCLRLIIEQQPVAGDLRQISSILKIITDLERIGDQCRDIAEISLYFEDISEIESVDHIGEMSCATKKMVHKAIQAFVDKDVKSAREVERDDDVVDNYFVKVRDDLVKLIQKGDIPAPNIIDLIMITKYLERIADHAVNVSRWVVFAVEG